MTVMDRNILGMTLEEYARHRGRHVQAVRGAYRAVMRAGAVEESDGDVLIPAASRLTRDGADGTVKFCLPVGAAGGSGAALESESVIIPMTSFGGTRWYTLCVSSQVGCRMGCTFCETGRMGLVKNLTAAEIVQQRLAARRLRMADMPAAGAAGKHSGERGVGGQRYFADGIQNIVFMGMGEPLDNFENVLQAIRVLAEPAGCNFPMGQITVSTVGRIDGLRRLGELVRAEPAWRNLRIAVSLNAAREAVRDELMPINRAMPLEQLQRALVEYPLPPKGRFLIEYVLIKGVNDSPADVDAVAAFCAPLRCIVNVIPYNPQRFAPYETPEEETVLGFMRGLKERGLFVKRRTTHGREMMGACGQLGNPEVRRVGIRR
ncbi:MAG TPA: 23S rRNA (adenine(2503)-C(2))-methyltransferase RlmN [Phycisphaerae bacterium]|nr:23S rRNA (adenine(2503)-C(2))-methyltransferase RlmN [Phycisphaerae bacterium]